jgi:3'-5' exoribonuclease
MFDPEIIQLFGIISSHHGKLEYGSPNTPNTLESLLIHFADHFDASMECAREALLNIPEFGKTSPIFSLENTPFVKLDNKAIMRNSEQQ